jgi:hypothetical protein
MRPLVAFVAALTTVVHAQPRVDPIPQQELENCGCIFRVPLSKGDAGKTVVMWDGLTWDGQAAMLIDGTLQLLSVTALPDTASRADSLKVGQKSTYLLGNKSTRVTIQTTVTRVCPPEHDSCEETELKATITVRNSNGRRALYAWGVCGC